MSKKCIICGVDLENEAVFCDECGARQSEETILSNTDKTVSSDENNNEQVEEVVNNVQKSGEVVNDDRNVYPKSETIHTNEQPLIMEQISKQASSNVNNLGKNSALGIASFVLGIISMITCGGFIVLGILGIIFGILGVRNKTKKHHLAITGLILSIISIMMMAVFMGTDIMATLGEYGNNNATVTNTHEIENEESLDNNSNEEPPESKGEEIEDVVNKELPEAIDEEISDYYDILHSYETNICFTGEEIYFENARYDTSVYIDGVEVGGEFGNNIYINAVLKEGKHEIWLTKTTKEKEKQSNKIEFEVSPEYTNDLVIGVVQKDKKEYALSVENENNQLFEGYEEEYYDGQKIIRTNSGKEIYYKVNFYAKHPQYLDDFLTAPALDESYEVARGEAVMPPEAPEFENYKFVGWSQDTSCIKENMDVVAEYEFVEEERYPEYWGEYKMVPGVYYVEGDYLCTLNISKITNAGIYFSLKFIDTMSGTEQNIENELAEWDISGKFAQWGNENYSFRFHLNENGSDMPLSVIITDWIDHENADGKYEKNE